MSLCAAIISPCGAYRYSLTRQWGPAKQGAGLVLWIMLNPSTADADVDDPTIRACRAFSEHWGKNAMEVVNLFALRSTDPRKLALADDPIGPDNDTYIEMGIERSDLVVAAWGAQEPRAALPRHHQDGQSQAPSLHRPQQQSGMDAGQSESSLT